MKLMNKIFSNLLFIFFIAACSHNAFDEQRAFQYVATQVAFGPRIPGSIGSQNTQKFISDEITKHGWIIEKQEFIHLGTNVTNIIAKNTTEPPSIIIGTHYDTRAISDRDPDPNLQDSPVPGANDGASGTAVLLELSRHLLIHENSIWLVFFDAEDQGKLGDWDWSIGAQYFVENLSFLPDEVIIIDMIGDADLNIFYEANSSNLISEQIWTKAHQLGYADSFIKDIKYAIIDDHLPFVNQGIPSVLLIDLDYEKWHTTQDDLYHISAQSLGKVGTVLLAYFDTK